MNHASKQAGWGFGLLWAAASTVGFALSATAFRYAGNRNGDTPSVLVLTMTLGLFPLVPTLPGILHWLILRRRFSRAGWWVLASGAGTLLGYSVAGWGLAVEDTQGGGATFVRFAVPASMAVAGAAVGVLQWIVLRRWVSHAGWWVLASALGWVVAESAYLKLTRGSDVHLLLGGAVGGALSGAITGLTLVGLMRKTRKDEPSLPVLPV